MTRIIIHVGGGLVQDVFKVGKGPIDSIVVVDFDVEGNDSRTTTKAVSEDGESLEAYVADYGITTKLPKNSDVALLVKAWEKNWKEGD